ncbi:phage terminase small subunit P27 family [Frankia sp. Mgl5]|uniref:phage terminase small subunit P27 family n=1 Tax=Frankia sp. Mgl5 TaxID=2933793 RepID=UPI00201010F7|nr:phage terminase small subunit P27 family [Frankia sp. Mgl5]MCK9928792.1 phage terminase small subunit P27 family [Frankia sp. Mgl5]
MAANAGRKPRPRALKLVEGRAPGRDSGGRPVPAGPGFVRLPPVPPVWLEGEAFAEWQRVAPELQRLALTKPIDAGALTAYCLAWARMVDAQAIVARDGLLLDGKQGLVTHPAVRLVEAASKELRAWASEFGLTPAAETKVGAKADDHQEDDDPFS